MTDIIEQEVGEQDISPTLILSRGYSEKADFTEEPELKERKNVRSKERKEKIGQEEEQSIPAEATEAQSEDSAVKSIAVEEYAKLEEQLKDSKKWGQQKNKAYLQSKRKITELVNKLKEEGSLTEDDAIAMAASFQESDATSEVDSLPTNPYADVKGKLDKEFSVYKRYNKHEKHLEEHYNAFYDFFPMMSSKEQEEAFTYLQEAESNDALDYVMTHGTELYNALYKGASEKGGIVKYVKYLEQEINNLEQKNKKLASEVDSTTKKVYRGSTGNYSVSREAPLPNTVQELYFNRYQN